LVFAAAVKKKRDFENRGEGIELQSPKTDGRFETYTGKNHFLNATKIENLLVTHLENVNTSEKETQIDHISMLKEYDLIRYQQQYPDQYRPYG
jgi:hypothetical protein